MRLGTAQTALCALLKLPPEAAPQGVGVVGQPCEAVVTCPSAHDIVGEVKAVGAFASAVKETTACPDLTPGLGVAGHRAAAEPAARQG